MPRLPISRWSSAFRGGSDLRTVLLAAMALATLHADSLIKEGERQRAPEFALQDASGNTVRMSDFEGKVVLLNFWATWCIPCKEEIPWFNEYERAYKDQGLVVVGINRDQKGFEIARAYIEKMKMRYLVLAGDAVTTYKYGDVDSLPLTFLIDRQRRVAAVHYGLVSRKKVDEEIRKLLDSAK
jgi:peroxiredoxin